MTAPSWLDEPARRTLVRDRYDVLVAGGGLGGVAAALAAARAGARTLLVERAGCLGGVATSGLVCSIFNCFYSGGEPRRLVTTGIAVEVADALAAATGYGRAWHDHRGHVIYDLEAGKRALARLVRDAGVEVLLGVPTVGVVRDGATVRGALVETKAGREALLADVVVDATGDADLAAAAGAPLQSAARGAHSLCFRLAKVDLDRFVGEFEAHPETFPEFMDVDWTFAEALAQSRECGTFLFPHGGGMQLPSLRAARDAGALPDHLGVHDCLDACQLHGLRSTGVVHFITGFTHFDGLDAGGLSAGLLDGREMAAVVTEVFRRYVPGFGDAFLVQVADSLGVRVSRWLDGELVLTPAMTAAGYRQPDAVARLVGWDALVKHPGRAAWCSQVLRADGFDVPLRCLLPSAVDGLLIGAGRAASVSTPGLLRTMVQTLAVGQAAGAAAAVSARAGVSPRAVRVGEVRDELRRQGVELAGDVS